MLESRTSRTNMATRVLCETPKYTVEVRHLIHTTWCSCFLCVFLLLQHFLCSLCQVLISALKSYVITQVTRVKYLQWKMRNIGTHKAAMSLSPNPKCKHDFSRLSWTNKKTLDTIKSLHTRFISDSLSGESPGSKAMSQSLQTSLLL